MNQLAGVCLCALQPALIHTRAMQIAAAHCGRPQSSPRCKPACFASVQPLKPSHAVRIAAALRPTASAEQQEDVVVVGAGVAGLNAATKLHAAGGFS